MIELLEALRLERKLAWLGPIMKARYGLILLTRCLVIVLHRPMSLKCFSMETWGHCGIKHMSVSFILGCIVSDENHSLQN